ncbi:fibrous sheath CABYR-binding protein isoform X2 [Solea solea]|uniref:fibrous sheath CABYR-binding protein isoform X2 n=1 Tax=Solea solea TaxID=90069 RepID=UPI00272BFAC7|nr:fibrous sheath CABYR-binding protein isoform X2 [Solea solea]
MSCSFIVGLRMEDTLQQEKQELDFPNPNEDQGGIRCRLRDRDLLRKRKAEAEQKETNQVASQRKRSRGDEKSGTKMRGRPRKTEPTVMMPIIQGESALAHESPAVVVVPEPVGVISEQTPASLTPLLAAESGDKLELQPQSAINAPASTPLFGSVQSSVPAPFLTPPAPLNQTPALVSLSAPAPAPAPAPALDVLDAAAFPVQNPAPNVAPVPVLSQASAPAAAAAAASPQVETLFTESQGRDAFDQVLIEDLRPDEEEDLIPLQDKSADEDLTEIPLLNVPEQNKMFSIPTLSTQPPPQEHFPRNSV